MRQKLCRILVLLYDAVGFFGSVMWPVLSGLSSYLVWVGIKLCNAKEEELLINDAS